MVNDAKATKLEVLAAGVQIANDCLGLAIPAPREALWQPPECFESRDELYGCLVQTLLGTQKPWRGELAQFRSFVPQSHGMSRMHAAIMANREAPDNDLIAAVKNRFSFTEVTFGHASENRSFAFAKIGHGYWEYLTQRELASAGLPYFRHYPPDPLYDVCGFDEMMAHLIGNFPDSSTVAELVRPEAALAIGFGSGDVSNEIECVAPLHAVTRGAMIGALASAETLFGSRGVLAADASPAKVMFWNETLAAFLDAVKRESDVVVFIVPSHLENIGLRAFAGETVTIVIPEKHVHELWPAVLAHVAGRLHPLLASGLRLSVFIQAAVVSVPLAILIAGMARKFPGSRVKAYDFGQVLDIALHPRHCGAWTRNPAVGEYVSRMGENPFVT